jgi:indole-3-glycerol phosphate synthase
LEQLLASTRRRLKELPACEPAGKRRGLPFDEVLRGKDRLDVIAEFKQASPSLGDIGERDVASQVRRYVRAGASAVSVLTEPTLFRGSLDHLEQAARAIDVPVLMKDFVVDPAQVRAAAHLGAGAVLLIVRCLTPSQLRELASACEHYGLVPLVECHDASEIARAVELEHAVIGLNNRDLDTLVIDRSVVPRLSHEVPHNRVVVAESGYEHPAETAEVRGLVDAVLIGSALMKNDNPEEFIREVMR